MAALTRLQLRTRALRAADLLGLIDESEANDVIQEEAVELYDLLCDAYSDYNITTSAELTVAAAPANSVPLPADFKMLRGAEWKNNGEFVDMDRFELNERNDRGPWKRRYLLLGDTLAVRPSHLAPGTVVRLLYTPTCPVFTDDVGTPFNDRGFTKRLILSAAIRFRDMEESSTTKLQEQLAKVDALLSALKRNRDAAKPAQVQDVRRDLKRAILDGTLWDEDI